MATEEQYAGMTQEDYLRMAGVETPNANVAAPAAPVVNDGSYGYSQMSAQQIVAQHAPSFNAASSDFSYKFLDGLGVERGNLWGHKGIWNQGDVRDVLADKSPNEILDAFAQADPSLEGITTLAKADPNFANSFKNVLVKDETMIDGMKEIFAAQDSGFNISDFERILADPRQRGLLGDVLDKVAESEKHTFADVKKLLDHHKKGETHQMLAHMQSMGIMPYEMGMDMFGDFMRELMQNPEMAINNLIDELHAMGMLEGMDPNMMKGFLAPMGEILAFQIEPYYDIVQKYDIGRETPGRMMAAAEENGVEIGLKYGSQTTINTVTTTLTEHIQSAMADGELTFGEYKAAVNATNGLSISGLDKVENIKENFASNMAGKSAQDIAQDAIEMQRAVQAGQSIERAFTNSFG